MAKPNFEHKIHDDFGGPFAEEGNSCWGVFDMAWIVDGDEKESKLNIRCYKLDTDGKVIFQKGGIALTEEQFNALILKGVEMGYGVDESSVSRNKKKDIETTHKKKSSKRSMVDDDEDEEEEEYRPTKKSPKKKKAKKVADDEDDDYEEEFVIEAPPKKKKAAKKEVDIYDEDDEEELLKERPKKRKIR